MSIEKTEWKLAAKKDSDYLWNYVIKPIELTDNSPNHNFLLFNEVKNNVRFEYIPFRSQIDKSEYVIMQVSLIIKSQDKRIHSVLRKIGDGSILK